MPVDPEEGRKCGPVQEMSAAWEDIRRLSGWPAVKQRVMALERMQTDTQVVFHSHSGEKMTDWAASVLAHLEGG
ncbi:hypothetical protein PBY51_011578 [Eleginops maclovinus]|uniref:Uncharacterized protein n=1 Tax=Eleginops maclovinus TaxID=56733 RepID=A0AAN8ASJ9_ELEMC|nr:hypothetical protein PBY51_011578 [Eleginops maclovinus]